MKGIVFSEFMEMVQEKFGLETIDDMIETSDLDSGGSYTSVGTYPHSEMVSMVTRLSEITKIEVPKLLNVFGHHLFQTFYKNYPGFFEEVKHPFDLLAQIDNHIHVEVKKLYPDAELPRFETTRTDEGMTMIYRSPRKMADLAIGLIEAAAEKYNQDLTIETELLKADGSEVKFKIS
jgi:hypothetical protein